MKTIYLSILWLSLSSTTTSLMASGRTVAEGQAVHADVQSSLCVNTKNNNSSKVIGTTKRNGVILKRDFNRIHCKKHDGFNGGNLYQTAFHYDRFGMITSFIKVIAFILCDLSDYYINP